MKHTLIFTVLLMSLLLSVACQSTPEEQQRKLAERQERQRMEQKREAEEQQRRLAEQEERRQLDQKRRAEAEERRAMGDRQRDQDALRRKYARYSTDELKLMRNRYEDASSRDLKVNADSDSKNTERLIEIERELLRRWKAGDAEAKLPEFEESTAPTSPKP